jgi:hypothetical protein
LRQPALSRESLRVDARVPAARHSFGKWQKRPAVGNHWYCSLRGARGPFNLDARRAAGFDEAEWLPCSGLNASLSCRRMSGMAAIAAIEKLLS